jgi:hypothetical protein
MCSTIWLIPLLTSIKQDTCLTFVLPVNKNVKLFTSPFCPLKVCSRHYIFSVSGLIPLWLFYQQHLNCDAAGILFPPTLPHPLPESPPLPASAHCPVRAYHIRLTRKYHETCLQSSTDRLKEISGI